MRPFKSFVLCVTLFLLLLASTPLKVAGDGEESSFQFQAEVSRCVGRRVNAPDTHTHTHTHRLMDIIINSLYSKKEVFLRELLSNASDALDRIRYLGVKDEKALGEGENRELEIRVSYDRADRTLTIRDRGVGMTRNDLIQNLGTVAKSGTTAFVEAMAGGQGDLSMIGQFGVGFYSVYLAADKVEVTSKHNDDEQWIWTSKADSTFTVKPDPEGNTLGRGTQVKLYMKEDADEFLDQAKLEAIIRRYSEFISYPIYLRKSKSEPVPDEDETQEDKELGTADLPPKKTLVTWSWVRVNDQLALWTRPKEDIADEEYAAFYKAISKDWQDPLTWTHFKAEGEIEFKTIMYVPKVAPPGLYDNYYGKSASLKLYVRKVLITDEFEDLMPRYLNFIKGVVDSDDLPLNVSREQLQQLKILKVIGKKLIRKVLEMLKSLSDDDVAARKKVEDGEPAEVAEETKFAQLWKAFSKSFKLGVIEDPANRLRLSKMLRFMSTKRNMTTLDEYLSRMPAFQTQVFYVAGSDAKELKSSPFLERAAKKGVEVLILADSLDEYVVQNMPDYEGKKLVNLAKEGVTFGDESEDDRRLEEFYKESFQPLTAWMKTLLGDAVEKVAVSSRVVDTPAVIVTSQFGNSANMERIMKSQAMNDPERAKYMMAKKILEVNPRHPIIGKLAKLAAEGSDFGRDLAWLLFDVAKINSGFDIDSPGVFGARVFRLMGQGLQLDSLALLPEATVPDDFQGAAAAGKKAAGIKTSTFEDLDEL